MKKQMRLYDIYQAIVDHKHNDIEYIRSYTLIKDARNPYYYRLNVYFTDNSCATYTLCTYEDKKEAVKAVNNITKNMREEARHVAI